MALEPGAGTGVHCFWSATSALVGVVASISGLPSQLSCPDWNLHFLNQVMRVNGAPVFSAHQADARASIPQVEVGAL